VEYEFVPEQDRQKQHEEARLRAVAGFFIVFGIGMLILAGSWLPRTIAIMSGGGVYGTYTVGNPAQSCNANDVCSLRDGTFRSDDGTVVLADAEVGYPTGPRVQEGDTFRAFSVGETVRVHTEEDRDDVPWPVIFIGGIGLFGILHGSLMFRRFRKAKRPGA
jgi:hypothetical protein